MNYTFKLKALTPMCHGDTVTGIDNSTNTRLFMRSGWIVNGFPQRVPSLSENALRSVLWRKPLADHLLQALGIPGASLRKSVVNLLYSGGNLQGGAKSPGTEHTLGQTVHSTYPNLELLSGAVDMFILPGGKLRVSCWPVAREFADVLRYVAPEEVDAANTVSIFDMLVEETRTRGTGGESDGNQMLYTYETLAAGARFVVRASLCNGASTLCQSALGFALTQWDQYFGGQGRQGRGLMAVEGGNLPSGDAYAQYITDNVYALKDGLTSGKLGTDTLLCGGG